MMMSKRIDDANGSDDVAEKKAKEKAYLSLDPIEADVEAGGQQKIGKTKKKKMQDRTAVNVDGNGHIEQ